MLGKRQSFQQMVVGKLVTYLLKNGIKHNLSPCTRVNSKCIKDLEFKPETLKLLKDGIGPTLQHIDMGRNFLNKTTKFQENKTKINKWDGIKLKKFLFIKGNHQESKKRAYRMEEELCQLFL